jgi:hypothetical protein
MGTIINVSRPGDCDRLGANYIYQDFNSVEDPKKIIKQGGFTLDSEAEIQALFDMFKADLPDPNADEPLYERTKYYMAYRLEMVSTFLPLNPGLTISDIDIIQ